MILVTGATGKVGREVVRRLAAAGVPTRALVRDPVRASHIRLPGVEIVVGDLRTPETLDAALSGVDCLFLLSPAEPDQVALQHNALAASRRAGVRHIVKVSVAGGPDAATQIGRWHWTTEKEIEASGLGFTFLRPNFYMQELLTFAPSIAATGALSLPLGTGEVSLVDARDVAAVATCALTESGHDRKIYDLTGPEALGFDAIADEISAATGRKISYVHVPPEYAKKQMLGIAMPRWLVEDMLVLCASFREGYGAAVSDAIFQVTKQKPRTFHQFVGEHAQAFRDGERPA